ncbi:hypothetical protein YPPY65_4527, partial [Yersinia pestis PY-65]
MGLAAGG